MNLTEVSIKRPVFISVIFLTLIIFGIFSYNKINYELIPKFEFGTLSISTIYIGASSNEVQTAITKPIEDAVASIEGIDEITSSSQEGMSFVTITLKSNIDAKSAQLDVERKLEQIKSNFPKNSQNPVVNRFSTDDMPIMQFSISSTLNDTKFYDFIEQSLSPILSNIDGVAQVNIIGGNKRQINVSIDNTKMAAYNIVPEEISTALISSGVSFPAGSLNNEKERFSIDYNSKVKSLDELRNIIIKQNEQGSRILLSDIASVTDGQTDNIILNRFNCLPSVGVQILKQTDANAVNVSKLINTKLEKLKNEYSQINFDYNIVSNSSVYTQESVDEAKNDLFLAIIIVSFVMLFFLHSFRSASFVLIAIPSALIPTFILMYAFGFTLNMLTLIGLSLVIGVLVDDSIVVLENIYRHLEMKKSSKQAAMEGRKEINITAIAITLVDVVVFVPLSLSGGFLGGVFKQFSLVIVFSTLLSLFVAFTLTPLMASKWGKLTSFNKKNFWNLINQKFENSINVIKIQYEIILSWALGHKIIVFSIATLFFISSILLISAGFIGGEFFPNSDRGEISVLVDLAPQTSLKQTNITVAKIEQMLFSHPEVDKVFSTVGKQNITGGANGDNSNTAELSVILKDVKTRSISTNAFKEIIRNEINEIPGIKPTIRLIDLTGNSQFDISLAVKGIDIDSVMTAAEEIKKLIESVPGSDYVQYSNKEPQQVVNIQMNREKMNFYGISTDVVGRTLANTFRGNNDVKYYENNQNYDISLKFDESNRSKINNIEDLYIANNHNGLVALSEIATIETKRAPAILERINRLNSITINSSISGRTSGELTDDIKKKIKDIKLPTGVTYSWEGMSKDQDDMFGNLGIAILTAILLMYFVMVALYESFIYPFVVLFSLPMALIGAILGLALTMNSLNLISILGILMLFGLVAKNGILLVDFALHQKSEGYSTIVALLNAGKERLRPILMTTVAMVLGMLPMALSTGAGCESKHSMAWVIIGGMLTSMTFTLILVPTVYMIVEDTKIKYKHFFIRKTQKITISKI